MIIVRTWGLIDREIGGTIWVSGYGQGFFIDENEWFYCYADHEAARVVL
jgi:hypothetical protein